MAYVDLNTIDKYTDNVLIASVIKRVNRLIGGYVDKTDSRFAKFPKYTLRRGDSIVSFVRMMQAIDLITTSYWGDKDEKRDFEDVVSGEGYYKCGCQVRCFNGRFQNLCWSVRNLFSIISENMEEVINGEALRIVFKINYRKFTVSYQIEYDEICDDCKAIPEEVARLKEVMRPDSLFQQAIYSHGLATGFGVNEVSSERAEENLKNLLDLVDSGKEICCSWKTQQIGGFGIFVRGEVTIASNRDLWSYVGSDGSREFNPWEYDRYLISRRDELDFGWHDHTEFFVRPKEMIAFWAKDWFVRDIPGGREFVEKLRGWGYKVYITRRRHR